MPHPGRSLPKPGTGTDPMNRKRLIQALGLAQKAGAVIKGNEGVHDAVRQGKAKLVLLADNASDGSKKKLLTACAYYQIEIQTISLTKEELAAVLGSKTVCAAIALKNHEILKLIKKN